MSHPVLPVAAVVHHLDDDAFNSFAGVLVLSLSGLSTVFLVLVFQRGLKIFPNIFPILYACFDVFH
jgi:hypothetical protein